MKNKNRKLSKQEEDELFRTELEKEAQNPPTPIRAFQNTDIVILKPEDILFQAEIGKNCKNVRGGKNWIIYVEKCEDRLLFEVILPMAKLYARKRKLVICDLESDIVISSKDCPLILLDAGKIGVTGLKKFLRLEKPASLCKYLRNRKNPVVVHLRKMGSATENLSRLLTGMLDTYSFGGESTLIILTGVHGEPGIMNCIHPGVTNRCMVCAVEW